MATINRSSIINNTSSELLMMSGTEKVPSQTEDKVRLVYSISPKFTEIIRAIARTTTTTNTAIYTTPSSKDFYLTFVVLCVTKDAASDNTAVSINVTTEGSVKNIINLCTQTLTAGSYNICLPLPYPLKIDRATAINIYMTFTVGTMSGNATVGGFILE